MKQKQMVILVFLVAVACLIFSALGFVTFSLLQPQTSGDVSSTTQVVDTPQLSKPMYFCGIDRCRDSGEYSKMVFKTDINVWNNPEPNRGMVHHRASHGDKVIVIKESRIEDFPGGLWFELEGGGWTNDLWLTDKICTPENLPEYSLNC